jgi:hypothetical protein
VVGIRLVFAESRKVAVMITWLLFRLLPESRARAVVLVLIVVVFGASFFRVYRIPGHTSAPPANLFEVYRETLG